MYCRNCFRLIESEKVPCPHCGYEAATDKRGSSALPVGTCLNNRFFIGRVLGMGGFGITYLAFDQMLGIRIAIKEYMPNEFATRVPGQQTMSVYSGEKHEQYMIGRRKFVDEARRLIRFQNAEGIVHAYDCFETNETAYITMEFLDGRSLKQIIDSGNLYSPEQAVAVIIPVLEALEQVHAIGMLHRDIAPDNIFIMNDGKVKLIDFGAARFATTSYSRSLSVIVKEGYAPEEQYRSDGEQGPWTDVYSVAATMYKMITGITPEGSLERMVKDSLKEPHKLGIRISKNIENAMMNALNLRIEDRPASAAQFRLSLEAIEVKRNKKKYKKEDVGRIPLWMKIGTGVVAGVIVFLGTLVATGVISVDTTNLSIYRVEDGQCRIPNLINKEVEAAKGLADKNNFDIIIVDKIFSDSIPEDRILSQSIKAGQIVETGTVVEIAVSGGAEEDVELKETEDGKIELPSVVFRKYEEAAELLASFGFDVSLEMIETDEVAAGLVVSQVPDSGTPVESGSKITIYVSGGEQEEALESDVLPEQSDFFEEETDAELETEPEVYVDYENDEDDYEAYEDDYGQAAQTESQKQSEIFDGGCFNITEALVSSTNKNGSLIMARDPAYDVEERCTKIRGIVTYGGSELDLSLNGRIKVEDTTAEPWIITDPLNSVSIERVGAEYTGHMVELYGYFEMNRSSEHCVFVAYTVRKLCCE